MFKDEFIYCSHLIGETSNRGIRDKNRALLKELKRSKEKRLTDELISNNRPLVAYILLSLNKYFSWIEDNFDDMLQQGYLYLCEAVQGYNFQKDCPNPVKFFGVSIYKRIYGNLRKFAESVDKRLSVTELLENEPAISDIPEVINPEKMEIDYFRYYIEENLGEREIRIFNLIYSYLKDGAEMIDIVTTISSKIDLSRERTRQIIMCLFRRLSREYRHTLCWDLS